MVPYLTFHNYFYKTILVKLPNGETRPVTHKGEIQLPVSIILKDTICIPKFFVNLLSVSKLTTSLNCSVIFTWKYCFVKTFNLTMIGVGEQRGVLYFLLPNSRFFRFHNLILVHQISVLHTASSHISYAL